MRDGDVAVRARRCRPRAVVAAMVGDAPWMRLFQYSAQVGAMSGPIIGAVIVLARPAMMRGWWRRAAWTGVVTEVQLAYVLRTQFW